MRSSRDIFSRGDVVLLVSKPGAGGPPVSAVLEALFDLTPKEALLARGLAQGKPLEVVTGEMSIQVSTARSHF